MDLEHDSALTIAAAIRRREVSPTEVLEATLSAIDRTNGDLNAIIWLDEDDARRRAREATDRLAAGDVDDLPPFLGVPIPVKDLNDVEAWPNTYGSTGASTDPAPANGLVVQRLVDAGFVLCGRSNTPEFGTVTATENDRYGITRNPWDPERSPGGSSGGAAASVAGGMASIGHASDGGGSIRIPASCTGLVGLKPARGRIVDEVTSWEGASTQGVVTRDVADTAAALDVLAVPDPLAWYNAPRPERSFAEAARTTPRRLRIAASTTSPLGIEVDPECVTAVERTLAALADAGHDIVDVPFEAAAAEFAGAFVQVVNAGLAEPRVDWDRVQPGNQANRRYAQRIDSLAYVAAVGSLQRWSRRVNAQWGGAFDLLVTPTMPIQPPPAGQILREITDAPEQTPMTVVSMVSWTSIFNVSGLPAISLPVHQAADTGLPVGVQLVGGPWQEDLLLGVATQVEQQLPWADRRPTAREV